MTVVYYEAISKKTGKVLSRQPRKSWVLNSLKKRHIKQSKVKIRKVYKLKGHKEYSLQSPW